MKTGNSVKITYEGRTVEGTVLLASGSGGSLILEFEAMLGGFVGQMPVLLHSDGKYRDLVEGQTVEIEVIGQPGSTVHAPGCKCGFCRVGWTKASQ